MKRAGNSGRLVSKWTFLVIAFCLVAASTVEAIAIARVAVIPHALLGGYPCGDADHSGKCTLFGNFNDTIFAYKCERRDSFSCVMAMPTLFQAFELGSGDGDSLTELEVEYGDSVCILESPTLHSVPTQRVWRIGNFANTGYTWARFCDLDQDGREDLVARNDWYGIWVFESSGNNRYDSVAVLKTDSLYCDGDQFAIGDFDKDTLMDLATAEDSLYVFEATGGDNQYVLSAVVPTPTGDDHAVAAARDMDNDGWPKIIVLGHVAGQDFQGEVMVFEATAHAQYHMVWHQAIDVGADFENISVGDVNGDSVDEFCVATGGHVYLYQCTGLHSYSCVWTSDSCACLVRLFDINNDGRAEIIFSQQDHCSIYEDTEGLTQVSESKPIPGPLCMEVRPAVVKLGASARFSGLPGLSDLNLYSVGGLLVRKQAVGRATAWTWDLTDQHGRRVPAGTYFAVIRSRDRITRTKLCVVN